MRYSQILAVASATLILAVPVPSPDTTQTVTVNGETYTLTFSSIGSDNSKRSDSDDTSLERRGDKVSSCGSGGDNWIPVEDFACYNDYTDPWCVSGQGWAGYRSAVTAFCAVVSYDATANRVVVPAGQKASLDIWTTGSSSRSSKALGRDFGGPTTTKVGQASIGCEYTTSPSLSKSKLLTASSQSRSITRAVTTIIPRTHSASATSCRWHSPHRPAMARTTRTPKVVLTSTDLQATMHCLPLTTLNLRTLGVLGKSELFTVLGTMLNRKWTFRFHALSCGF